ncbi:FkbM family methyltransferase [Sphingomonas humi]|uniref:[alpha-L-fucopyranosyl-(1->3)-alpha-L-rhamnopyran osyl-(1->3)-2-O-methyl-alpha-L-rhamnopyranosyl] dimycocerosyl phenol-phthiocerol 2'''-O-methyltransferase n=1 Tax=Sphingomonas humi TaxID=335630 RepID=A0ABP7RYZ0_9SPHN
MTPQEFFMKARARLLGEKTRWMRIESRFVVQFLRHFDVDCVFDVGANEGQYALRLRRAGFKGTIISFEPHPGMTRILKSRAAGDPRWIVIERALDSVAKETTFNVSEQSEMSSLHSPTLEGETRFWNGLHDQRSITIQTTTLDAIFLDLRTEHGFRRPFLKLDTQGHDMEVVRGGAAVMNDFVGLQSELAFTKLYENSPDYAQSLAFYQSLGFKISGLLPNNEGHFPDLLEMDCIMYRV